MKYSLISFLLIISCAPNNVKKSPDLPPLNKKSFSYDEVIQKEQILLKRADVARAQFKSASL